jgi:inner membrane protein
MRWATHAALALNSLWLLQAANSASVQNSIGILVVSAVFGGLLPDLDAVDSKLQRLPVLTADVQPFGFLSSVIRQTSPHRGWMHSLRGLAIISVVLTPVIPLIGIGAWLAFAGSYASHLLADMMNPSGIPLFFPQPRRWYVLPRNWRISTGSPEEELVFVLFACLGLVLLLTLISQRFQ